MAHMGFCVRSVGLPAGLNVSTLYIAFDFPPRLYTVGGGGDLGGLGGAAISSTRFGFAIPDSTDGHELPLELVNLTITFWIDSGFRWHSPGKIKFAVYGGHSPTPTYQLPEDFSTEMSKSIPGELAFHGTAYKRDLNPEVYRRIWEKIMGDPGGLAAAEMMDI
jgi:hypothetical protein